MSWRSNFSPFPPFNQLLKHNLCQYNSRRASLAAKIIRRSSNLCSQRWTRPTSHSSSGKSQLKILAISASHLQRKKVALNARNPEVRLLCSPALRAIHLQWKTIELNEIRARKVNRGLMSQLAALTKAATTSWSDSRSLTWSSRQRSLTSLVFWSGTAPSSW